MLERKENSQLYNFSDDNEWYTLKEYVIDFINKANIPKDKVIWCPFDKSDSNFVIALKECGYNVIFSHIDFNEDFFTYEPKHYDYIISNPPFKNKSKTLERLLELDKPFAMIFGIQCFNTGKFTKLLGMLNRFQICFLEKRMKFTKDLSITNKKTLAQPTFHSVWICNNIFDKDIIIW